MNNFLQFIEEDIEAKKTLISTMPTKTKTNKRKYNEKIDTIIEKYSAYKAHVKKYITVKSKSYEIKKTENDLEKISNKVSTLEHVRFILNPTNTYFEKMGFDDLVYELSNYYEFNFNSLNDIINQFLKKFELAGIKLTSKDFNYTYYVNEYMTAFFEARRDENYEKLPEIFEKIYWVNPEIIRHLELNFRKLIKKHAKKFIAYIAKLEKEVLLENGVNNYDDCLRKLRIVYEELNEADKENISDIIDLAKNGTIDMTVYFEDNKLRATTYESLMIDPLNLNDSEAMEKFYESLGKLKLNLEEYVNYMKFLLLINDFKNTYSNQVMNENKGPLIMTTEKNLKVIEAQIADREEKLEKINKRLLGGRLSLFESKDDNAITKMKIDSIKLAKELYDMYKAYDNEFFKLKVLTILTRSLTVAELLHLYYSFDYFKKMAIKKVFNITNYDEIIKYSDSFDLFAMNPTNIITKGIFVFDEGNVAKIIINKYRLDNINLTEEMLADESEVTNLLEKVNYLLRINVIEKSSTTVEKIWFISQVEKIKNAEKKEN
ncbi:MAG: hypothetical protein GX247_02345 [Mollicutes bacterium]|nr:hypothetical protein [Mollicutes bacterium]